MTKREIILCKDCKYRVEHHYEESGEEPYVKVTCGNKYGLAQKYTILDSDFCSRGEKQEIKNRPSAIEGWNEKVEQ